MTARTYSEIQQIVANNNADKSELSDRLIICLIWKESGFDPDLKNSGSSATGLMQVTKGAVAEVNRIEGTSYDHDDMKDPDENVEVGTTYLRILKKRKKGNLAEALDSYGTGPGYHRSIMACSACLKSQANHPQQCLDKIHK